MHWGQKNPENWTHRTRTAFLWLPKNIKGEMRWLETATWQEHYYGIFSGRGFWFADYWINAGA